MEMFFIHISRLLIKTFVQVRLNTTRFDHSIDGQIEIHLNQSTGGTRCSFGT
jgi:hypothetical protein